MIRRNQYSYHDNNYTEKISMREGGSTNWTQFAFPINPNAEGNLYFYSYEHFGVDFYFIYILLNRGYFGKCKTNCTTFVFRRNVKN